MISFKKFDVTKYLLPMLALVLVCLFAWLIKLPNINLTIALTGWSAIDWVAHITHPENFKQDFLNGIQVYDTSSFMHIYPLMQQWFDIPPESLIPIVILSEIVFLAGCGFYFFRTIAPKAPVVAGCIFSILIISSFARSMDLSNFGAPFFWGLFYNFADGFRLLAISLFIRRKIIISALFFAISFTMHPLIALYGCVFAFGFFLIERRIAEARQLALGLLLFCVIILVWWLLKFSDAEINSGAINAQLWIDMARSFSSHFFPVDMGFITIYHHMRLLPLLSLTALAIFYLPKICEDDLRCKAIVLGLFILYILVVAGLVISVFIPVPTLIKLALPRASALIILITLAISVAGLVREILCGMLFKRALASAILLSPFFMKPGFPTIPILLLIIPSILEQLNNLRFRTIQVKPIALCVTIILIFIIFTRFGLIELSQYPAYIGSYGFWLIVFAFSFLYFITDKKHKLIPQKNFFPSIVLLVLTVLYSCIWQLDQLPSDSYKKLGKDYLDAQLWANKNTHANALFMVDPTIYYGWRDFSSRSSFGNLREWLHTSWLYDSRVESYKEGMRRFNQLGLDIKDIPSSSPGLLGFKKLNKDVMKLFYDMKPQRFLEIADQNGINYLVLKKSMIHQSYPFKLEYENNSFKIYNISTN